MAKQQINPSQISTPNRVSLSRTTDTPTLPTAAWTNITFDQEDYDPNDLHSLVANTERITIKESGLYTFGAVGRFNLTTGGGIKVQRFNSSNVNIRGGVMVFYSGNVNILSISKETYLNAGDYLVMQAYSTAASNILTGFLSSEPEHALTFWASMRSK